MTSRHFNELLITFSTRQSLSFGYHRNKLMPQSLLQFLKLIKSVELLLSLRLLTFQKSVKLDTSTVQVQEKDF